MSDDDNSLDDERSRPTIKVEAVIGKTLEVEAVKPGAAERATASFSPDDAELQALLAATKGAAARAEGDESTTMISRHELFEKAALDRANKRQRQGTVPVESPYEAMIETVDITRQTPIIDSTTVEREVAFEVPLRDPTIELDATGAFARHTVGTADGARRELEFPARVGDDLRVPIPPELAGEIDLQPGDLVLVKIRRVRE